MNLHFLRRKGRILRNDRMYSRVRMLAGLGSKKLQNWINHEKKRAPKLEKYMRGKDEGNQKVFASEGSGL